jgi:hypothetical protein
MILPFFVLLFLLIFFIKLSPLTFIEIIIVFLIVTFFWILQNIAFFLVEVDFVLRVSSLTLKDASTSSLPFIFSSVLNP